MARLRRLRRANGVLLSTLLLLGTASASFHNHSDGALEGQLDLASRVPVSIIANPDAPSAEFHLHAGVTVPGEPCPACVLSSAHGTLPIGADVAPLVPRSSSVIVAFLAPVTAPAVSSDSRSPPTPD